MRTRLLSWPVLALGGLVLAAAVFGGGLIAGKALDSDGDTAHADDAIAGDTVANLLPRTGPFARSSGDDGNLAAPSSAPATDAAGVADERGGYGAAVPPGYYGCEALLGDVLQGTSLDPSSAGLAPKLLGSDFQLVRLNLWAEGDCSEDGQSAVGKPVLETSWRHTATGATVSLSQRLLGDPVANVRYDTSATVVVDGYVFTVNVWNNVYYYEDGVKDPPANADDVAAAGITRPSDQADLAPVLDAVLAEIAPSVPAGCYFVQTPGDWSDLAALGIGDPRPAIPSGFTQSNFQLYTFSRPDASCPPTGAEPPSGISFWAQWTGDNGRSYLEVNVYQDQYQGDVSWPGNLDEWGANWTRNGVSYGVWGSNEKGGLGVDVIEAVARAIDPQFSSQCLIALTPLSESDLAGLGINAPAADGWTIAKSTLNRRGVNPSCPNAGDYQDSTSYELNWALESDDGQVQAYAWMSGQGADGGDRWGYIYDGGIEWGYGNRNFSVWGDIKGDNARDVLVEIATSLDPSFNVDDLTEDGYPRPLPVDADGGVGSSGSTGIAVPEKP